MADNALEIWMPDTCGCKIYSSYDDTLPIEQRVYTYVTEETARQIHQARIDSGTPHTNKKPLSPARLCPVHTQHGNTPALKEAIKVENDRKNNVFLLLQEQFPALRYIEGDLEGNNLKAAVYKWLFDLDRVLVFRLEGLGIVLNQAQKNNLQRIIDNRLGEGLVRIE